MTLSFDEALAADRAQDARDRAEMKRRLEKIKADARSLHPAYVAVWDRIYKLRRGFFATEWDAMDQATDYADRTVGRTVKEK